MSMSRNFIILSVYLVISVTANPCQNAPSNHDINICEKGARDEYPSSHNVIIRADSMRNCSCELSINNQYSQQFVTIDRYGNSNSSHPGTVSGCGLIIQFYVNTDWFFQAHCSMSSVTRAVNVNQKIILDSLTVDGNLQKGSGYCIEIKHINLVGRNGELHLECGLQADLSTTTTVTSSYSLSTHIWTDLTEITVDDSVSTSNSSMSLVSLSTNNLSKSDPTSYVAVALGASVGSVVLLLLLVITILAVLKTRRSRSSKRTTSGQDVNEINASEDDGEYGLQYNSLYNMGFKPETNNRTNRAENKEDPLKITKTNKSVELNEGPSHEDNNGYHTIDTEMEIRVNNKPTDKDGTYSTIEDYTNHNESGIDDNDMGGWSRFPNYGADGKDQSKSLHKNKTDYSEDKNNTDVYAVPDKRKVKHVITTSGCEYAIVNK